MPAYVCVLTGKGYSAISSILLYGPNAEIILRDVFVPAGGGTIAFEVGNIFHGRIVEDGQTIDHIIVGCEGENHFAVHCHGNPILVQKIVRLLIRRGAQAENLECGIENLELRETPKEQTAFPYFDTLLEREAYYEQLKAVTIEGVKIIQSQMKQGLLAKARRWLCEFDTFSMRDIQAECREILNRSQVARRIIHGVKIVLAGPANSGKSTLLNTLAGGPKAIVSDVAGTTRDWVSVFIRAGSLRAEIIDTAGLGQDAVHNSVDGNAQQRTLELIRECDCVLLIQDCTHPSKADISLPSGIPVIEVLNKSDVLTGMVLEKKQDEVLISAKTGEGIQNLLNEILRCLQVCSFDFTLPVVFTARQRKLLAAIVEAKEKKQARELLAELVG